MDSTLRTAYNPQAPLVQPTSFHPSSSTGQSTMTAEAQNTLEIASNATRQRLETPPTRAPFPSPPAANAQASLPTHAAPAPAPTSDAYPHQINGLGGPTATAPFLQDFNLVAEAAKRAQMGIVMRDLESVTL
ncbi:hypothetical protein N7516_000789 [Penicillium verrucosum]|uniref:uncharacterized protein n=1 Tax=Penicillium verrucosum TaxID=60171 RepID=UPI00254557DE|nr:uncharacterized protein N7516_000789 [Penicillium verrucosum]KAJ5940621.1 hypothetical protein N7516_000789 [Penicillium verrucosum]